MLEIQWFIIVFDKVISQLIGSAVKAVLEIISPIVSVSSHSHCVQIYHFISIDPTVVFL